MRDDFSTATKELLAKRVGYKCSNPGCCQSTSGPQKNKKKSINIGVAAHISAASSGGKRYNPKLTKQERQDSSNGIWLCHSCGKLIDSDEIKYSISKINKWKTIAEEKAIFELENKNNGVMISAEYFERSFSTFVVIDVENYLPISLMSRSIEESLDPLFERLNQYTFVYGHKGNILNLEEQIFWDLPQNEKEIDEFYQEVIQFLLFEYIIQIQKKSYVQSVGDDDIKSQIYTPPQFRNIVKETALVKKYLPSILNNRFVNNAFYKFMLNSKRVNITKGFKIRFNNTISDRNRKTFSIILTVKNSFSISIDIEPSFVKNSSGKNVIPKKFNYNINSNVFDSVLFYINMKADFTGHIANDQKAIELKKWGIWMIDKIEAMYSDES